MKNETRSTDATQSDTVQRFVPPAASEQSEITYARDKCVVFHNRILDRPFPAALASSTIFGTLPCPWEVRSIHLCVNRVCYIIGLTFVYPTQIRTFPIPFFFTPCRQSCYLFCFAHEILYLHVTDESGYYSSLCKKTATALISPLFLVDFIIV